VSGESGSAHNSRQYYRESTIFSLNSQRNNSSGGAELILLARAARVGHHGYYGFDGRIRVGAGRRVVTKVLVLCGAGASSTFLVHWMRKGARARSLDLDIRAGALDDLPAELDTTDVVLVGPHLAASFGDILASADARAHSAILLPVLTFDGTGADIALDLVEKAITITTPETGSANA
jgi:PTS system cellobiose-specific IIB component